MLRLHPLMELVHPGEVAARAVFQQLIVPGYGVV
jgi:hypothetical protein